MQRLRPFLTAAALLGGFFFFGAADLSAQVPGPTPIPTPLTAGNCVKALNAYQIQDAGASCGTGAGTVNSGTQNQLGYYAAAGTAISGLATANSGVLITSSGGVPSVSSTLPSGLAIPSPTLTTPTLGVASATSINRLAITAPATSATLAVADGKTLTASNTLTFTGTDGSSAAFGAGGTVAYQPTSAGSWTPADGSGAGLTFTGVSAQWTQIGNIVFAYGQFNYPSTSNGNGATISGLPVTVPNANYAQTVCTIYTNTAAATGSKSVVIKNTVTAQIFKPDGTGLLTNANLSTAQVNVMCAYPAT